jgi:hypothetical protein
MKLKSTRRAGPAKTARVTILTFIAETFAEESELGALAIEMGAVSVPDQPPTKITHEQMMDAIRAAAKRGKNTVE